MKILDHTSYIHGMSRFVSKLHLFYLRAIFLKCSFKMIGCFLPIGKSIFEFMLAPD
jgi:hypothetical protein